jgi:carboxyl-terminal processing protease
MSSKSRWLVFLISTPLVLLASAGGLLGASHVAPPQQSFQHLRIFDDVVGLIQNGYVEPVDIDKVMDGAMRGLVDGLDPMSAFVSAEEVTALEAKTPLPAGSVGVTITRQFYLRVLGVRDASPAMRAGLRPGDFIRAIDGKPTRELSVIAGTRLLAGVPGSKVSLTVIRGNAAEPHVVELVRDTVTGAPVTSRRLTSGDGYVHVLNFNAGAAAALRTQIESLQKAGAPDAVIDLRGTSEGPIDEGIAAARLFVKTGTLTIRAGRGDEKVTTTAAPGDGAITMKVVLLTSSGTAGAAEVFAAALAGNKRAELVGDRTAGLAAEQHLIKLPEGRGLWLTYARYLAPDGSPIHERGLPPVLGVEEPAVAFGDPEPTTDDALTKSIERLKGKKTAP